MRILRTLFWVALAAGLSLVFVDSAEAIRILMHGRELVPVFRDDGVVFNHLETVFGADNVDYMAGADAPADGSAANGYDVLYFSSTMPSSALRDKYEDSPVGIVYGENALIDDDAVGNFMMANDGGNRDMVQGVRNINIINSSHPLAAGLSGEVAVYDEEPSEASLGYWWQFAQGTLPAGVTPIAESLLDIGSTDAQYAIIAADVGAQLLGDGTAGRPATAAGRRVFFFLSDFGGADLTSDGFALFDAAINWAATDPVPALGDYNENGMVDAADYTMWQDRLGDTASLPNDDTAGVGADDFTRWMTNFGNMSTGSGLGASAVPEPGTMLPAMLLLGLATINRRRRMM